MLGPGMSARTGTGETNNHERNRAGPGPFFGLRRSGLDALDAWGLGRTTSGRAGLSGSVRPAADQANSDVITTRYDYIIARAALEGILGREL